MWNWRLNFLGVPHEDLEMSSSIYFAYVWLAVLFTCHDLHFTILNMQVTCSKKILATDGPGKSQKVITCVIHKMNTGKSLKQLRLVRFEARLI